MADREQPEVGTPYQVEPLFLDAKHEDGTPCRVDIMHMLATDQYIRKTWEAAMRKLLDDGFPANCVVQVGFALKGGPDALDQTCILVFPEVDNATTIERSSPELWALVVADD